MGIDQKKKCIFALKLLICKADHFKKKREFGIF